MKILKFVARHYFSICIGLLLWNQILFFSALVVYTLLTGRTYVILLCYFLSSMEYLNQMHWSIGLCDSTLGAMKNTYRRIKASVYTSIICPIILFIISQPSIDRAKLFESRFYLPLVGTALLTDLLLLFLFIRRHELFSCASNQKLFHIPWISEVLVARLCGVCLCELSTNVNDPCYEVVKIPCSHVFHRVCIDVSLFRSVSCPSCRQDFLRSHPHSPRENSFLHSYGTIDP